MAAGTRSTRSRLRQRLSQRATFFLVIADLEHNLAALATHHDALERGPRLGEGEHGVDRRPNGALVDQPGELEELLTAGLDDDVRRLGLLADRRWGLLGHRDQPSALAQHGRRACDHLAADSVEDEIDR